MRKFEFANLYLERSNYVCLRCFSNKTWKKRYSSQEGISSLGEPNLNTKEYVVLESL